MPTAHAAKTGATRLKLLCAAISATALMFLLPAAASAVQPNIAFTSVTTGVTNSHSASINAYGNAVAYTATCSISNNPSNPGPTSCGYMDYWVSIGMGVFTEGAHTITVVATATDGSNQTKTITSNFTTDWTAPQTYYGSGPTNGDTITGTTASWTFSASEAATYQCDMDNAGFAGCASGDSFNGLADGSHDFQVRAVDTAGNVDASPVHIVFSVNNAPPTATIGDIASPTTSRQPYWSISLSRPDAFAECRIDGGGWSDCTTGFGAPAELADGDHTVEARAFLAGPSSVQDPPDSQAFTVDTTAPDLHFIAPKSAFAGTFATFQFASGAGDIDHFDCVIDPDGVAVNLPGCISGDNFAPDSSSVAGPHVLKVYAFDALGNQSAPIVADWTQYPSPPETTIATKPDPATAVLTAEFTFTSATAGEFQCSVDGAAFTSCPAAYSVSGLAEGQHALQVRAKDPAGQIDPTPDSAVFKLLPVPAPTVSKIAGKGKSISLVTSGAGSISVKVEKCKKRKGKTVCKKYTTGTATATASGELKVMLKKALKKKTKYRLTITSTSSTGKAATLVKTIRTK